MGRYPDFLQASAARSLDFGQITDLRPELEKRCRIVMSPLKTLRKFLKSRLTRYAATSRLYEGLSSSLRAAKRPLAGMRETIFPMWIAPRFKLAARYAAAGDAQKAIAIADDVVARKPDLYDPKCYWIASIYWLQGRSEDAVRLFQGMEERRREVARERQYDRLGLRFFPREHFAAMGHLGLLGMYVKGEILGIIPRRRNVILGPSEDFSNPAYLRYWDKYFSRITDPRTISVLTPLSYALQEHNSVVRTNKRTCSIPAFGREVQLQWEADGRGPLLELSSEHRERGYRWLRELGVPKEAWFVGLHVREGNARLCDVRNAEITTYRLAIEEIAKRGGWVLRMGDPKMRPLPPWPNTIDYALSDKREDWMDVFLWAEGRFFIGTGSGPQIIPPTFGKPVAIANFGPIATIICGKDDILLPKQYWHEKEGRYLTLTERMGAEYGFRESTPAFEATGIRILDNSPEELRDLVIEMIDRLQGRHGESEQERAMRARFAELAAAHDLYPVKIARAFMSRYPNLLG